MKVELIGVDCAAQDPKIGIAFGEFNDGTLTVRGASACSKEKTAVRAISESVCESQGPTLIAMDAPLGWPRSLSRELLEHRAGSELRATAHYMFRRETDRFIKDKTGKTPLDVGANLIARTAHAALCLLRDVRLQAKVDLPLAWDRLALAELSAIEVYPAVTLAAHGFPSTEYKKPGQRMVRQEITSKLSAVARMSSEVTTQMIKSADVLDAVVCLLAGKDFLIGEAMEPEDRELAEVEGWIWARCPSGIRQERRNG